MYKFIILFVLFYMEAIQVRSQNLDPWDQEQRSRAERQNGLGENTFSWGNQEGTRPIFNQGNRPSWNQGNRPLGNQGGRPFNNNQGSQNGRPFGNQANRPFGNQAQNQDVISNNNQQENGQENLWNNVFLNSQNNQNAGNRRTSTSTARTSTNDDSESSLPPNYSTCMDNCRVITSYNPVCGTDNVTYNNRQRLNCAINCGLRIEMAFTGACQAL